VAKPEMSTADRLGSREGSSRAPAGEGRELLTPWGDERGLRLSHRGAVSFKIDFSPILNLCSISEKWRSAESRQPSMAGQDPRSTQRRGAGVGGSVGHHAVVPAVVLSQPELHRTTLEGHEASRPIRSLPPTFRNFQAAIQEVLDAMPTKYSQQPALLMTLIFQQCDDVSLMAA